MKQNLSSNSYLNKLTKELQRKFTKMSTSNKKSITVKSQPNSKGTSIEKLTSRDKANSKPSHKAQAKNKTELSKSSKVDQIRSDFLKSQSNNLNMIKSIKKDINNFSKSNFFSYKNSKSNSLEKTHQKSNTSCNYNSENKPKGLSYFNSSTMTNTSSNLIKNTTLMKKFTYNDFSSKSSLNNIQFTCNDKNTLGKHTRVISYIEDDELKPIITEASNSNYNSKIWDNLNSSHKKNKSINPIKVPREANQNSKISGNISSNLNHRIKLDHPSVHVKVSSVSKPKSSMTGKIFNSKISSPLKKQDRRLLTKNNNKGESLVDQIQKRYKNKAVYKQIFSSSKLSINSSQIKDMYVNLKTEGDHIETSSKIKDGHNNEYSNNNTEGNSSKKPILNLKKTLYNNVKKFSNLGNQNTKSSISISLNNSKNNFYKVKSNDLISKVIKTKEKEQTHKKSSSKDNKYYCQINLVDNMVDDMKVSAKINTSNKSNVIIGNIEENSDARENDDAVCSLFKEKFSLKNLNLNKLASKKSSNMASATKKSSRPSSTNFNQEAIKKIIHSKKKSGKFNKQISFPLKESVSHNKLSGKYTNKSKKFSSDHLEAKDTENEENPDYLLDETSGKLEVDYNEGDLYKYDKEKIIRYIKKCKSFDILNRY